MSYITEDERKEAENIAKLLDVYIDGNASANVWMLPILKALAERLIICEQGIKEIESSSSPIGWR
jgi:hypothetical protein